MREMVESNIKWVGKMPSNWKTELGKHFMTCLNRPVEKDDGVITCFRDGEVTLRSKRREDGFTVSFQEIGYQGIEPGDLVVHGMDGFAGSIGISDSRGKATPVLSVLDTCEDKRFLMYSLRNMAYNDVFLALSTGIRVRSCDTSWKKLRSLQYALPPVEEQKIIADSIEEKSGQIDALIANEEAQIEKLKEYKQSLITEVVTKGLDPDAPMKDSFVDSIGLIPAHWDIKRAKYIANSIFKGNGITKEDVIEDGDTQCVRYGELYSKYDISLIKTASRTNKDVLSSPQYIYKGNILFACTGELVEEIGKNVVYLGEEPCLAGGDIIIMEHSQNAEFLNYAMYAKCSQIQKSRGKAKLKVVHISSNEIGNVIVALPPIEEQNTIANYLNEKCTNINELISIKQEKIINLNTYKKSLIYEYVTGKKEIIYNA